MEDLKRNLVVGAAPLRFSRVRVFGDVSRSVPSIDSDEPRSGATRAAHKKTAPLKTARVRHPNFLHSEVTASEESATRNRIPLHLSDPNR
jgi:hypothetical protein